MTLRTPPNGGTAAPPEAPFLREFFRALNASGFSYCVLRNYQGLPDNLLGSDLDLLVAEGSDIEKLRQLIAQTAAAHHGRLLWHAKNESLYSALCLAEGQEGAIWGVPIDVWTGIRWKGIDYYDARWLLSRAQEYRGLRVANFCDANMVGLFKDLLHAGRHREDKTYAADAVKAFRVMNVEERRTITGFFPGAQALLAQALDAGSLEDLRKLTHKLRRGMLLRLIAAPLTSGRRLLKRWLIYCARLLRPQGIFVAVLGSDGAGKSTLIDLVRTDLERLLQTETDHLYARPGLIPALSRWLGMKPKPPATLIDPHAKPPSGTLMSFIRLAYYSMDYVAGYWAVIYPRLVKDRTVIFFDRYFYDYYFDGKRFRVDLHPNIVSFFRLFIPRPNLTIVVRATPEIAHARKPELPLAELHRQYAALSDLAAKLAPVVWISSDGALDDSRLNMLEVTLHALCNRK